ncbi:MAG: hypothetical protein Q8P73_03945 [bacterium]|nr:hypothetical protein [bacterium]MDZ4345815.1 hypothetical protein [Candidatus Binatia bacterium]
MQTRSAAILGGLIRLYIRTARPVGSAALVQELHLSLSPATIRNILQELDDVGYIHQPHTSAGRIPTDKGYRYYVDHIAPAELSARRQDHIRLQLQQLIGEYQHLSRTASKLLSQLTHAVALCCLESLNETTDAGFSELTKQPDADIIDAIREVSLIIEQAEDRLSELSSAPDNFATYIGAENPLFKAEHTSMVVRTIKSAEYGSVTLAIIGPKRMFYEKNISLINALSSIIQKNQIL